MAYQIFALKWRPQNFDQIIGQSHVINLLKNSIQKSRLAYAYIFAGPRGVGKTSTARIFAKSLNCQNGPTVTPCQVCPPCKEITQCRSLDVMEIDGASNRGIDEIRALREGVRLSPSAGHFKVYIIDEVHMLTNEAFNALLKTLEEPPDFVKFIFATTQVNKIPSTILSRCQHLDFRRIPVLDIINQLKKISEQEKIDLEKEVLFSIARACDGSLRDAESILDQLTSFSHDGKISICDVSSLLGILEQQMLFKITERIISRDAAGALRLLSEILKQGKDSNIILRNIIEHFRNLAVAKISQADPQLIDLPLEIGRELLEQSQHFSLEEIFSAFNLLVNTQEMSKRMDSSIIPLEINLVRLTQEKKKPVSAAGEGIEKHKNTQTLKPDKNVKNSSAGLDAASVDRASVDRASVDREDCESDLTLTQAWPKVIDKLSKVKMSVATFLSEGSPLKLENDVLSISFPGNCSLHKDTLEKKENKLLIEKAFSEVFSKNLKMKLVISSLKPAQGKNEHKANVDSFLKSALNTFNARLL
ncbi:MAG: DNA polymerase III subunit gamma/tau [Candidatus Omnitrophota bacterium]